MKYMDGKEQLNVWSAKDYVKNILMLLMKLPFWAAQLLLCWIPVKKNRIVIYSLKQHGYSCNLKYLTEYLRTNRAGDYELLWIVRSEEDRELLIQRGIPAAKTLSWAHFSYRHRAGIVITNDEFYPMCLRRRGQFFVNTWHGAINYKKIGYDALGFTNPIQELIYRMNNPCPDVFVSGSRSFTDTTSTSFRFPREIFLEAGLPRNDILVNGLPTEDLAQLKARLGIPEEKKAVLYAPTFRKGKAGPACQPDFDKLTRSLGERFGGEWVVLLRQHYFVDSREEFGTQVINVSGHEDMQELILVSDCMVSDFSSCMWDFILTGKPCFVFAQDLEDYCSGDRSFFIPVEQWPYPLTGETESLCGAIETFDENAYTQRIRGHLEGFGSHDRGTAAQSLVRILDQHTFQGER